MTTRAEADREELEREVARRLAGRNATRDEIVSTRMQVMVERIDRLETEMHAKMKRTGRFLPCVAPDPFLLHPSDGPVRHPCVGKLVDEATGEVRICTCPCHEKH